MAYEQKQKSRKRITFDLHQESLESYYPKPKLSKNPKFFRKAYSDLKNFFVSNGWNHVKDSDYTSKEALSYFDINLIVEKLVIQMPWFVDCATKFDVTAVEDIRDLLLQATEVREVRQSDMSTEEILKPDIEPKDEQETVKVISPHIYHL